MKELKLLIIDQVKSLLSESDYDIQIFARLELLKYIVNNERYI